MQVYRSADSLEPEEWLNFILYPKLHYTRIQCEQQALSILIRQIARHDRSRWVRLACYNSGAYINIPSHRT
jgi:hypothetical protein